LHRNTIYHLGIISAAFMAPYCITKYGVEAFSDSLRREMRRHDVKVVMLEPQAFKTPLMNELFGKKLDSLWKGATDEISKEEGEKDLELSKFIIFIIAEISQAICRICFSIEMQNYFKTVSLVPSILIINL